MPTPDVPQLSPQYASLVEQVRAAGVEAGRALLTAETQFRLIKECRDVATEQDIPGVTIEEGAVTVIEGRLENARRRATILSLMLEGVPSADKASTEKPVKKCLDDTKDRMVTGPVEEPSEPTEISPPKHPPRVRMPKNTLSHAEGITESKLFPIGFDVGAERYINIISQENFRKAGSLARLLVGLGQGDMECFKANIAPDERLSFAKELVNIGAVGHQIFDDEAIEDLIIEALNAGYIKDTGDGLALTYEGLDKIYEVKCF